MSILSDIENNFSEITVNDLVRLGFKFRTAVVYWDSNKYDNLNDDDTRNKILEGLHYWKKTAITIKQNTLFTARIRLRYHPLTSTRTAVFNNEEIPLAGCLCCHDMTGKMILCRKVYDVNDLQIAHQEAVNC